MNFNSISNIYQYSKQIQYENKRTISLEGSGSNAASISRKSGRSLVASDGYISTELYTEFVHGLGYTDYHVFDGSPITVHTEKFGSFKNDHQFLARFYLSRRQSLNQEISEELDKNGIKLSPDDKLTFTVDKDCNISVSGSIDEDRRVKIEDILNSKENRIASHLFSDIKAINGLNGKISRIEHDKWEASTLLRWQTGQNLEDLELIDGKIVGANEKLTHIINSNLADMETESAHLQRVLLMKLRSVLAYGVDKIPDLKFSIDFQNNSLIDKDVKYGFGPEQLKTWFDDVISGKKAIDYRV